MTGIKVKSNRFAFWFEPAYWMTADNINFETHTVMVDDVIYTSPSDEFIKAFNADRLIRILRR